MKFIAGCGTCGLGSRVGSRTRIETEVWIETEKCMFRDRDTGAVGVHVGLILKASDGDI